MGRSWEIGKAFEQSPPCGEFLLIKNTRIKDKIAISLQKNNIAKQSADIS